VKTFSTRLLVPVVAIAACLFVLSGVAAWFILLQQSDLARLYRENLTSRRVAIEIDECLIDLLLLLRNRAEVPDAPPLGTSLEPLHRRTLELLGELRLSADQPAEKTLADQLERGFDRYLTTWGKQLATGGRESVPLVAKAADQLEAEVLRPCRDYKTFNTLRIDENTRRHERELLTLGWGLLAIGLLGSVAGVVLGYGLARAVRRSLKGVQLRIRDAAGRLGSETEEVVVAEQGEFGSIHAEIDELSERVGQVIERLHQREREIRRAEQLAALGQLAAGVAHEIRNPLTSIKLLVQSGQGSDSPLTQEDLQIIEAEVRRMEGSLQTFLDYARPQKMELKTIRIEPLLRKTCDLLRPRAERQSVEVAIECDATVEVFGDAGALHQVMLNLGLNALDAMPSGGTIRVAVTCHTGWLDVAVSDSGPGISADILPRLFTPFASGKDTGLGLGLVIARRIAEDHDGELTGKNLVPRGACFTLRLPKRPPDSR
jgi:two-component system, NtrC family, sensor histidine kinase HydH